MTKIIAGLELCSGIVRWADVFAQEDERVDWPTEQAVRQLSAVEMTTSDAASGIVRLSAHLPWLSFCNGPQPYALYPSRFSFSLY